MGVNLAETDPEKLAMEIAAELEEAERTLQAYDEIGKELLEIGNLPRELERKILELRPNLKGTSNLNYLSDASGDQRHSDVATTAREVLRNVLPGGKWHGNRGFIAVSVDFKRHEEEMELDTFNTKLVIQAMKASEVISACRVIESKMLNRMGHVLSEADVHPEYRQ